MLGVAGIISQRLKRSWASLALLQCNYWAAFTWLIIRSMLEGEAALLSQEYRLISFWCTKTICTRSIKRCITVSLCKLDLRGCQEQGCEANIKHASKCDFLFIICACLIIVTNSRSYFTTAPHIEHFQLHWVGSGCFLINISAWLSVSDTDEALPFYEVLVGVLSARHHYELRQAIRETWLGYLRDHPHFQHRSVRVEALKLHHLFFFFLVFVPKARFTQPAAGSK